MKKAIKKIGSLAFVQDMLGFLAALYVRFVYLTTRWERIGLDNHKAEEGAVISFFHSRIPMIPIIAKAAGVKRKMTAIVSFHRDGRVASSLLRSFGVDTIEGSTKRGGVKAAKTAIEYLNSGKYSVGICPDGPRGPAFSVSRGALVVARKAGVPVYGATYSISRCKVFRSWDRFMLPFPFAKGVLVLSRPLYVPKDADEAKMEEILKEFTEIMVGIKDQADKIAGVVVPP